jgi:hypothetical protein
MFDSLSDQMKQDRKEQVNGTERLLRRIAVAVISTAIFGGLYFAVRMTQ